MLFVVIAMTISMVMSKVTHQRFRLDVWWVKYPMIIFVAITSLFVAIVSSLLIWARFLPAKKIGDSFWENMALLIFAYIIFKCSHLIARLIEKSSTKRESEFETRTHGDCAGGLLRT